MGNELLGFGAAIVPAFVSAFGFAALALDRQATRLRTRLGEADAVRVALPRGHPGRGVLRRRIVVLNRRRNLGGRALLLAHGSLTAFVACWLLCLAAPALHAAPALVAVAFAAGAAQGVAVAVLAGFSASLRAAGRSCSPRSACGAALAGDAFSALLDA
ncbi:MAG: hypothetical protein ACJ79R_15300 [Anaeromyxobacteraceae bacterium]